MGVLYVRGLEFGWFLTKPLIRLKSLVQANPGPLFRSLRYACLPSRGSETDILLSCL